MAAISGLPSLAALTGIGYPMAWNMDKDVVEQVAGSGLILPNTWNTFDVYILWAATSTALGDVLWNMNYSHYVEGRPHLPEIQGSLVSLHRRQV